MAPVSTNGDRRSSGLLLHVTSLPGRFGIGDLGPEAHRFVDRIAGAGQHYWQMLPIGPTGYGNSPYSSLSTFAGNPLLISPDELSRAGFVDGTSLDAIETPDEGRVDYDTVFQHKAALLRRAAAAFSRRADPDMRDRYAGFCESEGPLWLDDYTLYVALKDAHGGKAWNEWDAELVRRDATALARARKELNEEIEMRRVIQFLFFDQWRALRRAAGEVGVAIVGDLPLYVAHDSADVWANPDLFRLDATGNPMVVAGVPPDYFSETGQRWGNPIYDWEEMAARNYTWWKTRVYHALSLFDWLRIDHFRGLAGYWEIPASEPTAVNGQWRPGPADELLGALREELGGLPVIAEDLGVITDDVIALRDGFGLPGMRVAQFGFDRKSDSATHHPQNYPENVWAYTGTHDNDTTLGWFWEGNPRRRVWRLDRRRRALYRKVGGDIPWGLMEMVSRSRAMTSVFPVQDLLGLGTEARMNIPGTSSGNWEWRLRTGQLTDPTLERLRELTAATDRTW
ncbi:MAG: 4-alpha-glucanotransferase [Actinomycetota bacterium]